MTKFYKFCLLVFIVLSYSLQGITQDSSIESYNKALIWRGMEHKWSYNHRANRLGSYVTMNNNGEAVHTTATGLGSDSTHFSTHYTYVEAANVYFKEVPVTILVNGKEGDLLTKVEEIYISADPWLKDRDNYQAVINGYEIRSLDKADQLSLFRFLVEDAEYFTESNQIKLTTHFNLVTNCRTIECPLFSNKTSYELTIHVLLIAYDEGEASLTDVYTSRNYVWDDKIEIQDKSHQVVALGQKDNVFPRATMGIKGIGIMLDEEHWLLEINNYVVPSSYDPKTGVFVTDANMKYVEWKKGMQQSSVAPFNAKFSKRRSGFALLDMNLALIQFRNAKVKQGHSSGHAFWKGWNKDASADAAKSKIDLSAFIMELEN